MWPPQQRLMTTVRDIEGTIPRRVYYLKTTKLTYISSFQKIYSPEQKKLLIFHEFKQPMLYCSRTTQSHRLVTPSITLESIDTIWYDFALEHKKWTHRIAYSKDSVRLSINKKLKNLFITAYFHSNHQFTLERNNTETHNRKMLYFLSNHSGYDDDYFLNGINGMKVKTTN